MTEYLDLEDLLAAADTAVAGRAEVRDVGLLQAAIARPQATAFGEEAYPSLDAKAAALLQSIVAGHPLVDGNKRLGWVATRLFYRMNGADIRPPSEEAFDLVVAIASADLRDVAAITDVLERWRDIDAARVVGETGDVIVVPLPAAAAAALPGDRASAARLIGATLADSWPQADLLDVLPMQAAAGPEAEPFGIWLIIERATNTVVGDAGFMGPPDDGVVEIGFSVVPDRRRRGYATQAVRALVDWALRQPTIRDVTARSDAGNEASARVLEAAGFTRAGERDAILRWHLTPG